MKIFYILPILLITTCQSSLAKDYSWKVKRVVDGDTLEVEAPFLPTELKLFVRVKNIDTPEKKGKCEKEKKLAIKASNFTTNLVKEAKNISFSEIEWDKYGGRVLAIVKISGNNLAEQLILSGLAIEYHGEKKTGWCD